MVSYAFFEEGTRPVGAPYELLAHDPESPIPAWGQDEYKSPLLVVAHPDDEMLWAGGLMLRYPDWEWSLVTVTDPNRDYEQKEAIKRLEREGVSINAFNLGFVDAYKPQPRYRRDIADTLCALGFTPDIVFTHNVRGEYGHHAHVWTHYAVHMVYENVWDFLVPNTRVKQMRKTLVREVPVDGRKRSIFDYAYGRIATGLRENAPWATERMDACAPELFTQGVVGL